MEKRSAKFGLFDLSEHGVSWSFDTAEEGWTLTSWEVTEPVLIENYIDVPGRLDGPLDASTALTNGDPRYGQRKLTATFECSDGTREQREAMLKYFRNKLDGLRLDIAGPDDLARHYKGRLRVEKLYSDLAHASVRVTATCDPWRYYNEEKVIRLEAVSSEVREETLYNDGRRLAIPTVETSGGSVNLSGWGREGTSVGEHSFSSTSLSPGTYQIPNFYIGARSSFDLSYSGSGTVKLTYREADL